MKSGIAKKPVAESSFLDTLGFHGDGVADTRVHGGADKAVCVYCIDHFPFWKNEMDLDLNPGAFGENLSVSGLCETRIHIGDIFRIGEAEVQCSQPREPCHKVNKFHGRQEMACKIQTSGYSGYYMRVLKPGWIDPGAGIALIHPDPGKVSVHNANVLMHQDKKNYPAIEHVLEVKALSDSWRKSFEKRLNQKIKGI